MAMVKVYRGEEHLTVSAGAYKTMYAPAGWSLIKDSDVPKKALKVSKGEIVPPIAVESATDEIEEDNGDANDADTDGESGEEEIEYVDPADLREKPIEELDFDELKILAEDMGISVKGVKSSKVLREAIKKAAAEGK